MSTDDKINQRAMNALGVGCPHEALIDDLENDQSDEDQLEPEYVEPTDEPGTELDEDR